jgi:hypothetical protein
LPPLVGIVLGALLLSACTNGLVPSASKTAPSSSPVAGVTPTLSVNQTIQSQATSELQSYQQWIALLKQFGGNVTTYQQQYTVDQHALTNTTVNTQYTTALATLKDQVQTIKLPAMKQEAISLQQTLQKEVSAWGKKHTYHDSFNNTTYQDGYEYDDVNGVGGPLWLQEELNGPQTLANYQQTIEDLNMWLYNFQEMKADFNDKTPYNKPHQSDLALLKHDGDMNQDVVVVSLDEEAARVYHDGKLVYSLYVTTGQPDLVSPPGTWWIEGKQHPTVFKSDEPKSSPDWYPPTKINYAMAYHSNGYFLHDAWWRTEFGPGTNFPHQDPDGDPFAGTGSHGCINMSTKDAAWIYNFVSVYTAVIVY